MLDPRVKLVGAVIIVSAGLLVGRWSGLAALLTVVVVAALAARASGREVARDVWFLRYLYAITIVLHCLLGAGEPILRLPFGIEITYQGFMLGCFFSAKIALLAVLIGLLMRTTHPAGWTAAVEAMSGLGGRLAASARRLSLTAGLAVRFLPMFFTEAERIRWAQIGRGLEVTGGPIKRARSLMPLMLPLVASSLDRVDQVTVAMQSRGFRLDAPRTRYRPLKLHWQDAVAVGVVVLTTALVIIRL